MSLERIKSETSVKVKAYIPEFVEIFGSLDAAVFCTHFAYWSDRTTDARGVYKTQQEIRAETGLTRKRQEKARKTLVENGVLVETHDRLNHRVYYRIDADRLIALINGEEVESDEEGEYDHYYVHAGEGASAGNVGSGDMSPFDSMQAVEAWERFPRIEGCTRTSFLQLWRQRRSEGVSGQELLEGCVAYVEYAHAHLAREEWLSVNDLLGESRMYAADWH
ncbi:hypothetical protein [Burkholderia aenigmatica]|uniref:hypothetical protein n=1 Tax=Burkholderia aenigmatica TaxID=2015348 RepID=UPI001177D059|nr:hypothetical protein [Burkholderia aenigmatica]